MRRLSMKNKRRKSETVGDESAENGVMRNDASDGDVKNKKATDSDSKEASEEASSKRAPVKKRASRGRSSLKRKDEPVQSTSKAVNDVQGSEEKENGNFMKPSPNKRRKKEDQKSSTTPGKPGAATNANSEHEYEVDKIVGHRHVKGRRQFLVRWKGYGEDSDTWEQEKDLNCAKLIEEFLDEYDEDNEIVSESEKNFKTGGKVKTQKLDKKTKKTRNSLRKEADNGSDDTEESEIDEKDDNDNQKEFEVEKILEVRFKNNKTRQFLIRWKGFSAVDDTWEPEENLNCPDLIVKFMQKLEKAKMTQMRELRANPAHTKRYTLATRDTGRRLSRRNMDKQRQTYHECDE